MLSLGDLEWDFPTSASENKAVIVGSQKLF